VLLDALRSVFVVNKLEITTTIANNIMTYNTIMDLREISDTFYGKEFVCSISVVPNSVTTKLMTTDRMRKLYTR